jgi:hypothetical protein
MKIQRSENDQDLLLYDEERENKYPVFEDYNGTHIMKQDIYFLFLHRTIINLDHFHYVGFSFVYLEKCNNYPIILNIKKHANVEIEVQVHGMTCMFQSKRMLLGNY